MSPETKAAIERGKPLTKKQFHEYLDSEALSMGIPGGADEVIRRVQAGIRSRGARETTLHMSVKTYLGI